MVLDNSEPFVHKRLVTDVLRLNLHGLGQASAFLDVLVLDALATTEAPHHELRLLVPLGQFRGALAKHAWRRRQARPFGSAHTTRCCAATTKMAREVVS